MLPKKEEKSKIRETTTTIHKHSNMNEQFQGETKRAWLDIAAKRQRVTPHGGGAHQCE